MKLKVMKLLCALGLVLVSGVPPLTAARPSCRNFVAQCGRQCTWDGPGEWSCWDDSNPERACWSYYFGGACGEDSNHECCGGGFGGF